MIENKRPFQGSEHQARAESNRRTVGAYADDVGAFARDLARAELQQDGHAGMGKECNCGLCGAVARADMSEIRASAHLAGAECGCGRCAALAALADEANCPSTPPPTLNTEELQRKVDDGDPDANGAQPATPGAAPAPTPAPAAHANIDHAHAGVENAESNTDTGFAEIDVSEAEIIQADVAAQFAETRPVSPYFSALANMISASADVMQARAGMTVPAFPPGFPGTLGLTTWNYGTWTYPKLDLDTKQRLQPGVGNSILDFFGAGTYDWVAKVKPTTSADPTHSAVAAPTGKHKYTTQSLKVKGKPTTFDVQLEITPAYYTKIFNAEQEHLSDLLHAYNLSIKAAADAVNSVTANEYIDSTQAGAEAKAKAAVSGKLHAKLGDDPANWRAQLVALCTMTISGRDAKGWHSFGLVDTGPTVVVDVKAKTITHGLNDGTTSINTANSAATVHF